MSLIAYLCIGPVSAQGLEGNILHHSDAINIEILEDPRGELRIEDVAYSPMAQQFQTFSNPSFNYGITTKTIWLRLTLPPGTSDDLSFLEVVNPYLDMVRMYTPDKYGFSTQQAGDSLPFNERPYAFRTFVFDLDTSRESGVYYLQLMSSGNLHFMINLWSSKGFTEYASNSQLLIGLYFGLVIIMGFYNLLIYLTIREKAHLYYVIYIASFCLFVGSMNGLTFQYLWPDFPSWAQISISAFAGLVVISALVFTREFLQTMNFAPQLDRLLVFLIGLAFMQTLLSLSGEIAVAARVSVSLGIILPPIIWLSGLICWRAGYRPARFLVIAWSVFLVTVMINGLTHADMLPATLFTTYAMQTGSALEVILLSWALADRMAVLKKERGKIQQAYLGQLKINNVMLEDKVRERTSELSKAIDLATEKSRQLEKANIELKELATRDGLTALLNHHTFIEQFKHLIEDARRYKYYISVLLIDLDNFKQINDKYGHLAGNSVLVEAARIFRKAIRESDLAARYGGEEFVIVMSRATLPEAMEKAEQIREQIDQLRLDDHPQLKCSVSVGVTTVDWRSTDIDYNMILSAADTAMYTAKSRGKNRICSFDSDFRVVQGNNKT